MRKRASRRSFVSPRLNLRSHPLESKASDFARIFQVQFVFDVRPVGFHGLWTDMQLLRDLTHFFAFADQFQNFKFAITESLDHLGLAFSLAMREFSNHLRRHGWTEIRASIKNFV